MKRRLWTKGNVKIASMPVLGGALSSVILLSSALALFTFSGISPSIFDGMRIGASNLLAPVLSVVSAPVQRASVFIRDVSGLANMQAESVRLAQENVKLREWYQAAMSLEAENTSLRDLLNVKIEARHSYITGRIIADSGNAYVKSLLLSVGKSDGVKSGQAVLSGDGVIGRVVEVGRTYSRILLLTDINSRIPVMIEGENHKAVLAGTNDSLPELMYLPPDSDIADGARLVTSGHGGLLPPGLPVGLAIVTQDGAVFADLYANMDSLVYVRVLNSQAPLPPLQASGAL